MENKWPVPQEVIVVEGRADTRRLIESFGPAIKTIETGGSAIDQAVLDRIQRAQTQYGVIVLTDPDFPGKKIRQTIAQAVPGVRHAYLSVEASQAKRLKGSLGVEHAPVQEIRQAIQGVMTPSRGHHEPVAMSDLLALKLIGHPEAQSRRDLIASHFHLGHLNGKQLQKGLSQYGISLEAVRKVLEEVGPDEGA